MRFNELLSGSKQDIAVKIFGDDLDILSEKAANVERIIQGIEGVEDINVEKLTGLPQVQVEYDRDRLAQYGLSIAEVNRVLRAAFAGSQAGVVYDGEMRFGLVVRLDKDYRENLDDVKNLSIPLANGVQIPLEQIANIEIKAGPAQVSRENTKRRITIGFNVRNRDVQSVIKEVTNKIDASVTLPTGYFTTYGGQFKNLQEAKERLAIAVPVALILIFILLFFTFNSIKQSVLIFTAVPMATIGGVFALWFRDLNFSISAGVGFIALFGVAVLNGIVLISEFNRLEKEGVSDITERVLKGLKTRLRPVIMTAAVASLGFLPMALSTSAGAEVQRPLATVVIGGLLSATFLTLIILPIFYILFSSTKFRFTLKNKAVKIGSLILLLSMGTLFSNVAKAQQLNLKQIVQMALDSNLAVKSSAYSVQVQKALKGASWDIPKTAIDMEYGEINSLKKDNSLSVSQSFAFPTVYINQNKLADANVKSSEWEFRIAQLQIATQVKQVYYQLVYLNSKQQLLAYQDSLYSGFLRAATLRANLGETNRLEMVTARSQSMEVKNQLQEITADLDIYNHKLQTLLNTNLLIINEYPQLTRIQFNLVDDSLSLTNNPSASLMKQRLEVSHIEKKLEQSRMLPDFTIGYFSQTMIPEVSLAGSGTDNRFNGIQAGIEIPLWAKPFTARNRAASLKEDVAKTSTAYYLTTLAGNFRSLMGAYEKYNTSVEYYEKQAVPEANSIIKQASLGYKVGAIDYLDYITSLTRALSIKQNYLDVLNDYNQTIISIDFITGKIF